MHAIILLYTFVHFKKLVLYCLWSLLRSLVFERDEEGYVGVSCILSSSVKNGFAGVYLLKLKYKSSNNYLYLYINYYTHS